MPIPLFHRINIFLDDAHIEVEEGGVYRVTTRSLTGMGTHTRWYYPEEPDLRREGGDGIETIPIGGRRELLAVGRPPFNSCIDGTLSAIPSRGTTPGTEVERDNEYFDDHDMDAYSDTTEIIGDRAENERSQELKASRDGKPLPDLPYERIMIRISREPTVILDSADPICIE